MNLGEKQELFSQLLPLLLLKAWEIAGKNHHTVRVGDLFRDPRVHGKYGEKVGYSSAWSMHKLKLAVDLNFIRGPLLLGKTSDFQELGEWWEKKHELCRWGGRFNETSPGSADGSDGNHFSLTHDGRA